MITDPAFYAVAMPAALLVGISKSGFASGIGALATPLLAMSVTVPQAAALVLPLLCLSDVMGLMTLRRHADWTVLRQLLPAGLIGIVLGWIGFGVLSPQWVGGLTGLVTLIFLAWTLKFPPKASIFGGTSRRCWSCGWWCRRVRVRRGGVGVGRRSFWP